MCSGLYPLFPHSLSSQFLSCTTNFYCTISISISTWLNMPIVTQSLLTSYFFLAATTFPCVHDLNLEKLPVCIHGFWPSFPFLFFKMLPHSPLHWNHLSKNHLYVAKSYGHESFLMLISHLTTTFSFRIFLLFWWQLFLCLFVSFLSFLDHCSEIAKFLVDLIHSCGFKCYLYFP